MQQQQISTGLPKEAYLSAMYLAFAAIRSAKNVDWARKIAHVFHNLPSHLKQAEWDGEAEQESLKELETNAAASGLSDT